MGNGILQIDLHHYTWREVVDDGHEKRLLTPHSDPMEYEYPVDFIYETRQEAIEGLIELGLIDEAINDKWTLVEVSTRITHPDVLISQIGQVRDKNK